MTRRVLLTMVLSLSACSGDGASADDFELTTDASSYEWIPGVPPPSLTVALSQATGDFVDVLVCSHEGAPTTPIQYQQQQGDSSWANIPFGTVACNSPRNLVRIESGATWTLPPEAQAFPPDAGTYRIVLLPDNTSVDFPIVSNSFTVVTGFEPAS